MTSTPVEPVVSGTGEARSYAVESVGALKTSSSVADAAAIPAAVDTPSAVVGMRKRPSSSPPTATSQAPVAPIDSSTTGVAPTKSKAS